MLPGPPGMLGGRGPVLMLLPVRTVLVYCASVLPYQGHCIGRLEHFGVSYLEVVHQVRGVGVLWLISQMRVAFLFKGFG